MWWQRPRPTHGGRQNHQHVALQAENPRHHYHGVRAEPSRSVLRRRISWSLHNRRTIPKKILVGNTVTSLLVGITSKLLGSSSKIILRLTKDRAGVYYHTSTRVMWHCSHAVKTQSISAERPILPFLGLSWARLRGLALVYLRVGTCRIPRFPTLGLAHT